MGRTAYCGTPATIAKIQQCRKAMYESEITQFLKDLKQAKPHLEQSQQDGRALLWDRILDEDTLHAYQQAKVPQAPYVYQTQS